MPKRSQNFSEEYSHHKRSQAQAIGARIAQRRKQLRLTQKDLRMRMKEENIPVSRSQFSRIENGQILPDAGEVIVLALVLDVLYQWLPEGKGEV